MADEEARNAPIRVLIADEQPLFATALELMLADDERIEVVGHATNGRDAVELAKSLAPDVVLMDISMPLMDGFEATRRILTMAPSSQVVMLTGSDSRADAVRARNAGAVGFVAKSHAASSLLDAILAAASRSGP
jgi:DNA-binding NarL/FixJ family response regulator